MIDLRNNLKLFFVSRQSVIQWESEPESSQVLSTQLQSIGSILGQEMPWSMSHQNSCKKLILILMKSEKKSLSIWPKLTCLLMLPTINSENSKEETITQHQNRSCNWFHSTKLYLKIRKVKFKDKLKDTHWVSKFLMKLKTKLWDSNNNWKLKWLRSRNKDKKLIFWSKKCNMNHQSLNNNKPRLMKKKQKLMPKRMLLKSSLKNVELPLKRLNQLWEKPKEPLNVLRKIISVKWKPSQVLHQVLLLLAESC